MTINTNKVQLTPDGFSDLNKELKNLREEVLPKAITRIASARALGDLSENYEYQSAKEDHLSLVSRIEEVTELINHCQVIEKSIDNDMVDIGHQVEITINDSTHTFTIVGEWEADPSAKKISHKSPLGIALIGKQVGDKAEVEAPVGKIIYTIKAIN